MLIEAIFQNQNLGRLKECVHFQQQLQQNLIYLATHADEQPELQRLVFTPHASAAPATTEGGSTAVASGAAPGAAAAAAAAAAGPVLQLEEMRPAAAAHPSKRPRVAHDDDEEPGPDSSLEGLLRARGRLPT